MKVPVSVLNMMALGCSGFITGASGSAATVAVRACHEVSSLATTVTSKAAPKPTPVPRPVRHDCKGCGRG